MNIVELYDKFIDEQRIDNEQKRYHGKEDWYHASSTGSCIRKQYYRHVEKVKEKPFNKDVMRLFRLGNIVHDDIQKAISLGCIDKKKEVYIEKEIQINEWNVRGFLDMLVVSDKELYDIKTCNHRKFKTISGDLNRFNEPINYYLQLATYGYWYEQTSKERLNKMSLLFYNKDNSDMKEIEVDRKYLEMAKDYWLDTLDRLNKGKPNIEIGYSPVHTWECNYCNFFDYCGEGFQNGKRKNP
jgi:CRISPR/Cas system-associated exonuclease Cas4 (RecB family)